MHRKTDSRIGREVSLTCAIASVLLVTLALRAIAVAHATTVGFAYLVTILVIAASWGLLESVLASITATFCFNFFFLPPIGTWVIDDLENWVGLFTFLFTSLVASKLSDRARRRTVEAWAREAEMERLYALSRAFMMRDSNQPVGSHISRELARIYQLPAVAIYNRLSDTTHYGGPDDITWVHAQLRQTALTDSHPKEGATGAVLAPITLGGQSIGSLAIQGAQISNTALQALLNLVAISLENERSREIATRAQAARQSEEFKSTLLDGLAHEFKTPLTSIRAATTALLSSDIPDRQFRQELLTIVDQEAARLSGLVSEATHLARIEAGKLHLNRQPHSIKAVIQSALEQMESRRDGRPIDVDVPTDLPAVAIDRELIEIALRQLIDNAVKYSPPRSPIRISARSSAGHLFIAVHNSGETLSDAEGVRIFDKFYRGARVRQQIAGTGMGLPIAREILLAHGGDIRLNSSSERGTEFALTLPCHNKIITKYL